MATSVTTETVNGDLCELPPDPGKSPGPWKRSKEDGNPPLSFRDVLMQVQHKGSCYLEISEPESEGFESDEWEEDEQQIHNIMGMRTRHQGHQLALVPVNARIEQPMEDYPVGSIDQHGPSGVKQPVHSSSNGDGVINKQPSTCRITELEEKIENPPQASQTMILDNLGPKLQDQPVTGEMHEKQDMNGEGNSHSGVNSSMQIDNLKGKGVMSPKKNVGKYPARLKSFTSRNHLTRQLLKILIFNPKRLLPITLPVYFEEAG